MPGFATNISAGPPNEGGQTLVGFTLTQTATTGGLTFSTAPAIALNGTLTYTAAANANGTATFSVVLSRQRQQYAAQQQHQRAAELHHHRHAGQRRAELHQGRRPDRRRGRRAQTVAGWATTISPGPPNESGQTVSFVIDANTNPGLFTVGPAVASNGTLTYTPAPNQHGTATITLHAQDNGGTADGGVNVSAPQTFTITVTAVNDPPTSPGRDYGTNSLQTNMQRSIDAASGLLVGASDTADTSGNAGYTPVFTVGTVNGVAPVGGTITATIAGVGNVVANASTGAFTIDPAPGVTGNVSFTLHRLRQRRPGPERVQRRGDRELQHRRPGHLVRESRGGRTGDGRLSNPFKFLSGNAGTNNDADDVDAANHRIFVYSGTPATGGIALNAGEWLIGQGVDAATNPSTP